MYKKFISSKTEDLCLYIQCYCGAEILKLYYYRSTPTCPEVLMLDYFGELTNNRHTSYKYMSMSQTSFFNLINALKQCENDTTYDTTYDTRIEERPSCLRITRKGLFTTLTLYRSVARVTRSKLVKIWDITIHSTELQDINKELEEMKNKYEVLNNVTRSNQ